MTNFDQIKVDFNIPTRIGNEIDYIRDAYDRRHISGDGYFTRQSSQYLQDYLGCSKVLLTTSCTHALEMSALLLDIQPGDEVIVPSFTFVSTVNAFVLRGAKPVFIDIRPDTLNLDETLLAQKITDRTRAVVPVHYAGVGCEMDAILPLAARNNIAVVEDDAHGLFGSYKGKKLGTFGQMATLSFHETKNVTCGEGGALIINDPDLITRAEYIREKGTNRSRFFQGMIDKYTWVDIGSSYLPSDILGAVLYAQLEQHERIQTKRQAVWDYYQANLQDWAANHQVQLPTIPAGCQQSYHMFYMLLPTASDRSRMIAYLRENGIISVFHYLPLHLSDMGRRFGCQAGDCPVTEDISARLIRLPFHYHLDQSSQDYVIEKLKAFKFD